MELTVETANEIVTQIVGDDYSDYRDNPQAVAEVNKISPQSSYKTPEALFASWVRQEQHESLCDTAAARRAE